MTTYDDVVDMEAYALAKVCHKTGIDFISFKYITDDGNADDWETFCAEGAEKFRELLDELL